MNIDVFCPNCGTLFTVRRDVLGKKTKCTKCGTVFVIAEPVAAAAPMPAPPPLLDQFPEIDMSAPAPAPRRATQPNSRANFDQFTSGEFFGFEVEASKKPRFPALRIVAKFYEILAILVLAFAALLLLMFFIGFLIAVTKEPENGFQYIRGAIAASGIMFFWVTMLAVGLLFIAQLIRLALQVEQNTRETRDACQQLADHLCDIERAP